MWPIRIFSILLFGLTVFINYYFGGDGPTGAVSDNYHLYITPPNLFFRIWIVIFTTNAVINIVNFVRNTWSLKTHIIYGISNMIIDIWIFAFGTNNNGGVFASPLIITLLAASILLTWIFTWINP